MSDYKHIELFTETAPGDFVGLFDVVVAQTPDGSDVEARQGDDGSHVAIRRSTKPMPGHPRSPFVLVNLDHQLSELSIAELATSYAGLAVQFVQRADVDGGIYEDPDECRYLLWERGGAVTVNSHPYPAGLPFVSALTRALDGAGITWEAENLGLYFDPRGHVSLMGPGDRRELVSVIELDEAEVFRVEVEALSTILGADPGFDHPSYLSYRFDRQALVSFADLLLSDVAIGRLAERYRSTIVRVVATALRAGLDPAGLDRVAAGLVAEARTLG